MKSARHRLSRYLALAAGLLILAVIGLIGFRSHLPGLETGAGPQQIPVTLDPASGASSSSATRVRPERPARAASSENPRISPFAISPGEIDPAWLASRGIAGDRAAEATTIVSRYCQLSADLLISRLVPLPEVSDVGAPGLKAYRLAPLDDATSAAEMDRMRAELRSTFGGSAGEFLFRDLEFESQFSGLWAGTGDLEFIPLPDGTTRWKFILKSTRPQGGSGENGFEMMGRDPSLPGLFGTDFHGFY